MTDPNNPLGDGGLSPINRGPTLDEEEKALRKGNTGVLIGAVIAGLAVVVAMLAFLFYDDGSEQYRVIGVQINTLKGEHFDTFWACALPTQQLDELHNNQDLSYAIHRRARRRPNVYATHIRNECLGHLNDHEAPIRALIAPEDLQPGIDELLSALNALEEGWAAYLDHLDAIDEGYDEDDYDADMNAIGRAWHDYRHTHRGLNDTIGTYTGASRRTAS